MNMKKLTQKDRYGNQISMEFEAPEKPLDPTKLMEKMMDMPPQMDAPPQQIEHPGQPKGSDTIPAWLTPGEFVVNAEAMRIPGVKEQIESINNQGRAMQEQQGGQSIPQYSANGGPAVPFIAGPRLNEPQYQDVGGFIDKGLNKVTGGWWNPYIDPDELEAATGKGASRSAIGRALGELKAEKMWGKKREKKLTPQEKLEGLAAMYIPEPIRPLEKGLYTGPPTPEFNHEEFQQKLLELNASRVRAGQSKPTQYLDPEVYKEIQRTIPQTRNLFDVIAESPLPAQYQDDGGWINDDLLNSLRQAESRGTNHLVSKAGAVGEYQWLPSSAAKPGYKVKPFDPLNPAEARDATRQYLTNMQKHHGFSNEDTLRAYNWGPGNVMKYNNKQRADMPQEAQDYPGKVLGGLGKHDIVQSPIPRPTNPNMPAPQEQQDFSIGDIISNLFGGGDKEEFKGSFSFNNGGSVPPMYASDGTLAGEGIARAHSGDADIERGILSGELYNRAVGDGEDLGSAPTKPKSTGAGGRPFGVTSSTGAAIPSMETPPAPAAPEGESGWFDWMKPNESPVEAFGGEGDHVPNESWRKMYDETHPEYVPQISETKLENDKNAAERAQEVLMATDPSSPYFETRAEHAATTEAAIQETQQLLKDKEAGLAVRKEVLENTEKVNLEVKAEGLQIEADKAREAGNEAKANALDKAANAIEQKLATTPDKGQTKEQKAGETATKIVEEESTPNDTGPGEDQPGTNASPEEVEKAAIADPAKIEESEGVLKGFFGDLFDKDELKRMAIMYAGSRLMGYSHAGSLKWGAGNYLKRVDAKAAAKSTSAAEIKKRAFELAKTDKFSSTSIKNYETTGDISYLQPKIPANSIQELGNSKTFYQNGQQIQAREVQVGNDKLWVDGSNTRIDLNNATDDASMVEGTKEFGKRVIDDGKTYSGMIKGMREQFGTIDKENGVFATEIVAESEGTKAADWALKNKVPPQYMGQIIEGAMHSAMAESKISGRKVRDLKPYLNAQYVSAQVGDTTLFKTPKGETVSGRKVQNLLNQAVIAMKQMSPDGRYDGMSDAVISTAFMQNARVEWNGLGQDVQSQYLKQASGDESGFMQYVKSELQTTIK